MDVINDFTLIGFIKSLSPKQSKRFGGVTVLLIVAEGVTLPEIVLDTLIVGCEVLEGVIVVEGLLVILSEGVVVILIVLEIEAELEGLFVSEGLLLTEGVKLLVFEIDRELLPLIEGEEVIEELNEAVFVIEVVGLMLGLGIGKTKSTNATTPL